MPEVSLAELRAHVAAVRGPQFRLPARFAAASLDDYRPDPAYPGQAEALTRVRAMLDPEPPRRRLFRRAPDSTPRGLYLDGPPGVGKTHLMAAAFNSAPDPRLFVTFDELSAAAGTLGMSGLSRLLANQRLVCIDEIDLRDPANIMLLVSLLRAMLAGSPRIIATANADPLGSSNSALTGDDFRREVGEIASAFTILRVDGVDRRLTLGNRQRGRRGGEPRCLRVTWELLLQFLIATHPMYDAAWLDQVDTIEVDRVDVLDDVDHALRFVRFIDRVYDRDVALVAQGPIPAPDAILRPLIGDRRFVLHVARCRSRLIELLGVNALEERAAD